MFNLRISVLFFACTMHLAIASNDNKDDLQSSEDIRNATIVSATATVKETEYGWMDKALIAGPLYGLSALQFAKICTELTAPQLAGRLVAGYLAADLVTGIVHAATDELPGALPESIENHLVNLNFLRKADDGHHKYPTKLIDWGYWHNNRPYHLVAYCFLGASAYVSDPVSSCILISVALLGANSEFFHAAAHGGYRKNPIISKLQDWKVILGKRHHAKHHNGKFDRNFCLISGWMDYLLNPTIHYLLKPMGSVTKGAFNGSVNFFRSWCGSRNKECILENM